MSDCLLDTISGANALFLIAAVHFHPSIFFPLTFFPSHSSSINIQRPFHRSASPFFQSVPLSSIRIAFIPPVCLVTHCPLLHNSVSPLIRPIFPLPSCTERRFPFFFVLLALRPRLRDLCRLTQLILYSYHSSRPIQHLPIHISTFSLLIHYSSNVRLWVSPFPFPH